MMGMCCSISITIILQPDHDWLEKWEARKDFLIVDKIKLILVD